MWIYASNIASLNLKKNMFKLIALAAMSFLLGCDESLLELSGIRTEAIDRLAASKLIPNDQRLPENIRKSSSISVIEFDYQKKSLGSLPDEGGVLKVELLRCSNNELLDSTFMYIDKLNVTLSANKREILMLGKKAYFFVDGSMVVDDGCFKVLFKSISRSKRSAVYRIPYQSIK